MPAENLSLRDELRRSTADLHARVDAQMTRLLQMEDGYACYLLTTAAAVLPLECALYRLNVSKILPDWPRRSRSAALLEDLDELSLVIPRDRRFADERLHNEAFKFGVLYVLEGSRLGAKVLLRELEKSAPTLPTRFLTHGQGQPLWGAFIAQLEASNMTRENPGLAIEGARSAFEMFTTF